ncbi:beta-ketoacyl synthase N-terminal-like domain-containing protein [Streptomyces uncialis]|uniref:beta-ketoacyl synthase N-terminal-like domain-containing protein n=1 Tax=Streptomyces uncialis TaxID=1048205 RepID=UPI00387037FE|nr:phosphopantetheine-binding protein [Streptomyces uncialis]
MEETAYDSAVALVGMAGRFPGADDVGSLWRNLRAGVSGLRPVTDEELDRAGVDPALRADPAYVRVGGPVDGLDRFDAAAFGFSAREAETMEPQHRLFLECSWEALERAGYCPTEPGVPVGVFAGCGFPDYMVGNVSHLATERGAGQLFATGNERDSLTSLVSYKLGLRGPSLTVQTFCSTSLVAVHLACQSLLTYECDMALAGGAYLPLPQPAGYLHEEGGILSPDGRVRSLGASANGTVMGSGVGVVTLKRLADAQADGDVVHAVILGSAVNNDGRERAGYAAPGVEGQAAVVGTALAVAGVKPESVGYVECHAVGTGLGDSIEFAALGRVFRTPSGTPCVLSSVKPSIGHLDRAAGVTGLMRAALSLRHETLPGTAHFEAPNPTLATLADRFTVLARDRPWPAGPEPRRAGVSAFGVGGTNAHVVLEQAPAREPRPAPPGPHLLTFSAGGPQALDALTERLRAHLDEHREDELADVAFTLQMSRGRFALRRAVVCADHDDAVAALADPARLIDGETVRRDPWVRLTPGDGVPDAWWSELAAAADRLLTGGEGGGERTAGRDTALAALGGALSGVGVRVWSDGAVGATEEVVVAPGGRTAADWVLTTLARLWQAGASIDWAALHAGRGRRVELPSYPFQRSRHWVDAEPPRERGGAHQGAPATFLPDWRRRPLPLTGLDARLRAAGPWLLLAADARGEALGARLLHAGAEVVTVRPGGDFAAHDDGDFTVRADSSDDLTAMLRSQLVTPRTVVHGFALAPDGEDGGGLASALAVTRAYAGRPVARPAALALLTSGAVGVGGTGPDRPGHAALAAWATQQPDPFCHHVDLDAGADPGQVLAALTVPHEGPVAVRGDEAWVRCYQPHPLAPDDEHPFAGPGETVLITDGLGPTALPLALRLARAHGPRLVLTTPVPLPDRAHRDRFADDDGPVGRAVRAVAALEATGAPLLVLPVPAGDEAALRAAVRAAVDRFGSLDVLVHSAGPDPAPGPGLPEGVRAAVRELRTVIRVGADPAVRRRVVLAPAVAGSGAATAGPSPVGAALAAYAGAARPRGEGRWTVVTRDAGDDGDLGDTGELLARAASAGHLAEVMLSTRPLAGRSVLAPADGRAADAVVADEGPNRPRPALATPYVEPAAGLERTVADLWAAGLGLDSVGADDNFFELGGRSLVAVQLALRVREALRAPLPSTALVEHPTVRLLSAEITALTGARSSADDNRGLPR